ncbi:UBP-type zinc finger domain-containing protein [Actinocorallia sp. A-T 12471]|uniref:UBP-type zinc finger domain-containing protein n=1 Tax=Actinocorallia sp. A-T 12471 TaxID=3089813 RepID=UPI0029CB5DEA|nr:UBP-type zinc finger domain-containing protein [Actinocorallia sp. A-T 12471]MDX6740370.1 UBP-type zinc finger domain-containing protein [Actinocorallia sp. A-T 12471]
MGQTCTHLDQIKADARPSSEGCEDCLRTGGRWVHLRMCRTCGHVGCCDSSPNTHATAHFHTTDHPLISSYEPGEDWTWCYKDDTGFRVDGLKDFSHP